MPHTPSLKPVFTSQGKQYRGYCANNACRYENQAMPLRRTELEALADAHAHTVAGAHRRAVWNRKSGHLWIEFAVDGYVTSRKAIGTDIYDTMDAYNRITGAGYVTAGTRQFGICSPGAPFRWVDVEVAA